MIVSIGAVALAFIGAVSMAVSGEDRAKGGSWRGTAWVGIGLIGLAMAMVAAL